ncbi:MAG: tryptophan 2,3-dioxygenase [Alphaproteobacteria bacterium]|nr:tryptophan 2,3-dioxygenase [Alphaproteobacteria bacterium]MBL6937512.1 tryptophan 2,3-dioxygenase [Alphaproteobacteria bacterium]MBL7098850.1 tryptophan 2,3-dioxygenase [Alphaproteobacteria bacterium]
MAAAKRRPAKAGPAVDLRGEAVHWDFRKDMSYGDYLGLTTLLSAQKPLSGAHDEMLFLVIHQSSELWIKLCLHELTAAIRHIRADDLGPAFKMMARIARVQVQLIQSWEILSTMTPFDYASFRGSLGKSSGFQSFQYRMLEFRLGNKNAAMARVFAADKQVAAQVRAALTEPSVYDESLALLARRGFKIPKSRLQRDFSQPYAADRRVTAAWREVYRDAQTHWDLYELAEKLVDLEYRFHLWRFSHMKTVERIIGNKMGTGGTSGVNYLKKALGLTFYPELWEVRTEL